MLTFKEKLYRLSLLLSAISGLIMLFVFLSIRFPDAAWSGCRFSGSSELVGCHFSVGLWIALISLPLAVISAFVRVFSNPPKKQWADLYVWVATLLVVFARLVKDAFFVGLVLSFALFVTPIILLFLHEKRKQKELTQTVSPEIIPTPSFARQNPVPSSAPSATPPVFVNPQKMMTQDFKPRINLLPQIDTKKIPDQLRHRGRPRKYSQAGSTDAQSFRGTAPLQAPAVSRESSFTQKPPQQNESQTNTVIPHIASRFPSIPNTPKSSDSPALPPPNLPIDSTQ